MEIIQAANGPDWAAILPMIQAQQRAMAQKLDAEERPYGSDFSGSKDVGRVTTSAAQAPAQMGAAGRPGLTDDEQRVVNDLKARDREVRDHEQAHARVGGTYASQPSYSYQMGPDGNRYAVGGEVQIDVSPVPDDPAATIAKMDVVKAAALAPAEPSSADRQVASLADAQRAQAIADLTALRASERRGDVDRRI